VILKVPEAVVVGAAVMRQGRTQRALPQLRLYLAAWEIRVSDNENPDALDLEAIVDALAALGGRAKSSEIAAQLGGANLQEVQSLVKAGIKAGAFKLERDKQTVILLNHGTRR
jgi:hypothetical protein